MMFLVIFTIFCGVLPTTILALQYDLCRDKEECTYALCEEYAYEQDVSNGPPNWNGACLHVGTQSPIDIDSKSTTHMNLGRIGFTHDYKKKIVGHFLNDGASISFSPDNKTNLNITGGPYGYNYYQLDSVYFHWGCNDDKGSEHKINGKRFSMEMQLKHFKLSYGSLSSAILHPDGLAIISFLFEADDDSDNFEPFEDISEAVKCTRQKDFTTKTHVDLWEFFEAVEPHDYYTYSGSLANPGCQEAVIWTIYDKRIRINSEQLKNFRRALTCRCTRMCNNGRHVQPIGSRTVIHSRSHHDSHHH